MLSVDLCACSEEDMDSSDCQWMRSKWRETMIKVHGTEPAAKPALDGPK